MITILNILLTLLVYFLLIGLCIAIAAFCNSIMDTIKFHWYKSKFKNIKSKFWNDWFHSTDKQKYKTNEDGSYVPAKKRIYYWYYLWLIKPTYAERFPYSTTALIWVTDAWHFFQFMMFTFFQFAIFLPIMMVVDFALIWELAWYYKLAWFVGCVLGAKVIFGGVFELFYSNILLNKNKK